MASVRFPPSICRHLMEACPNLIGKKAAEGWWFYFTAFFSYIGSISRAQNGRTTERPMMANQLPPLTTPCVVWEQNAIWRRCVCSFRSQQVTRIFYWHSSRSPWQPGQTRSEEVVADDARGASASAIMIEFCANSFKARRVLGDGMLQVDCVTSSLKGWNVFIQRREALFPEWRGKTQQKYRVSASLDNFPKKRPCNNINTTWRFNFWRTWCVVLVPSRRITRGWSCVRPAGKSGPRNHMDILFAGLAHGYLRVVVLCCCFLRI